MPASSLNTSVATAGGTWATVVMGGPASQENNFWQLFVRPAASSQWKLVTPPGTADNGGLILAAGSPQTVTAFRPSQDLTFTPLTQTSDGGQAWSSLSPLDAPLASTPSALAIPPAGSRMLALLTDGTAETAAAGSATWKTLATERTLAATPAGRHCGLQALTAAAYTPSGAPLLAGTCSRPGSAGIFADTGGTWQPAGPALPAALAPRPSPCCGSPRPRTRSWHCWKQAPGPPPASSPPGPPTTPATGPCHPPSRSTAPPSPPHRSGLRGP